MINKFAFFTKFEKKGNVIIDYCDFIVKKEMLNLKI